MINIALLLIGMIVGVAAQSIINYISNSRYDEIENILLKEILKDMDDLMDELDQHGFIHYRMNGKLEIRKKPKKRTNTK